MRNDFVQCSVHKPALTVDDVRRAVGEEEFDIAGGEAVIAQHCVDVGRVLVVPATMTPTVPAAGHEDGAVADLEEAARAAGASQGGVGGLTAAVVLADRIAQARRVVARRQRRARGREAGDVGAARQQLVAAAARRPPAPAGIVMTSRTVVVDVDDNGGDQREEVDLAAPVEVAPTTATVHRVSAASLRRQHHAIAVS